jgi:hypothetical protein
MCHSRGQWIDVRRSSQLRHGRCHTASIELQSSADDRRGNQHASRRARDPAAHQ